MDWWHPQIKSNQQVRRCPSPNNLTPSTYLTYHTKSPPPHLYGHITSQKQFFVKIILRIQNSRKGTYVYSQQPSLLVSSYFSDEKNCCKIIWSNVERNSCSTSSWASCLPLLAQKSLQHLGLGAILREKKTTMAGLRIFGYTSQSTWRIQNFGG